jgi:phage-related protein
LRQVTLRSEKDFMGPTENSGRDSNKTVCYATEVKEVVSRLLDLVVKTRFASLSVDTDEDCPWVRVWYRGKSINVNGNPMTDRTNWISPEDSEDAESWSFSECCQRALAEAEKLA